jgi:transposase
MEREDGRTLTPQQQHERRKQAVRLHKRGVGFMDIAEALSMSHVTVRHWVKVASEQGMAALKPLPRGRKVGDKRQLTSAQELSIQKQICENRPEQLKLTFALWTRAAVALHIEQELGIKLPIRSVGEYLRRWGFTPQRPTIRAYEQKPEAVKAWLDEVYPAIAQQAKAENAQIHWGDETALTNTDVRGRGFQPKGQTPVAYAVGGSRQKLSMISTVTNQGLSRWMIVEENFDAAKFIEFLQALIKDTPQKIFLIVDNLRVHHAKLVKAWEQQNQQHIKLFYLPSYSPQLNPDERLNADLKYAVASKVAVRTKAALKATTIAHMTMLEQNPERVKSYFQDVRVKYAA